MSGDKGWDQPPGAQVGCGGPCVTPLGQLVQPNGAAYAVFSVSHRGSFLPLGLELGFQFACSSRTALCGGGWFSTPPSTFPALTQETFRAHGYASAETKPLCYFLYSLLRVPNADFFSLGSDCAAVIDAVAGLDAGL